MLTAMSLKPLGLSSLYGLWLVLFSRLPSCFPEDLASPACLALQEKHLALLLLNWNLKYSNAQTLLQKSGDFLFSEMKGLSHSWPVEASKQVSKADRSWHLRSQFFFPASLRPECRLLACPSCHQTNLPSCILPCMYVLDACHCKLIHCCETVIQLSD